MLHTYRRTDPLERMVSTSDTQPVTAGQDLLDRIEKVPPGPMHRKLMFQGGLGYTFDSFDGALMTYALSAVIVIWDISSGTAGWLLSALFFGYLVGALGAGVLADRFGRRRLMLTALMIFCVCSVLMGTSQSVPELFVWRVLAGIGIGAETTLIAPYISEFLPAKYRGRFVARTVGFLAFGYVLAGIVAPLIIPAHPENGWRYAAWLTATPVVLLLWWRRSLPESPRYLIGRGRFDEAAEVVERLERASGVTPPPPKTPAVAQPTAAPASADPLPKPGALAGLASLRAGPLVRTTAVLWVLWFILIGVNYGFQTWLPALLVSAKGFTVTKSLVFALVTSIAQIPGYYIAGALIDKFERKWLIAVYAAGATVSALGFALAENELVLLTFAALVSAFTNGAAGVYYTYTAELYPTEIRTTGMGAASAVGRIGAITAPIGIGYLYAIVGFTTVFLILVAALAIAVVVVMAFGERTSGRSLENLEVAVH